jgi:hypothetical protein
MMMDLHGQPSVPAPLAEAKYLASKEAQPRRAALAGSFSP